jgi:anti-sigma B factor antagonist
MTMSRFQESEVDGITILSLEPGIRGTIEFQLKDRIDDLVRHGRLQIVVDLRNVPYVDSSDIGRIIRAHLSMRQAGGRVRLCHLSERVLAVLKMSRLDSVLEIYATLEEAMAVVQQPCAEV